jgi:hypothetical protein
MNERAGVKVGYRLSGCHAGIHDRVMSIENRRSTTLKPFIYMNFGNPQWSALTNSGKLSLKLPQKR